MLLPGSNLLITRALWLALLSLCATSCVSKEDSRTVSGERVVSLDYCADQFVLRFVPGEQIAAVSPDARKYFSFMRDTHLAAPPVRSTAEDVLALQPTRVVRSYGGGPGATAFFTRAGIDVVQLGYPSTIDEVKQNILNVSTQLGNRAEGVRVVEEFDQRLAQLSKRPAAPSALYTTPGGVTTGPGSLVHQLMLAAGLTNFEERSGWRDLPLERLVYTQPDQLANATFGDQSRHVDPWTRARHPRAKALMRTTPGVAFEGAWTSCGAWFLMDAIEALAEAPSAVERPADD